MSSDLMEIFHGVGNRLIVAFRRTHLTAGGWVVGRLYRDVPWQARPRHPIIPKSQAEWGEGYTPFRFAHFSHALVSHYDAFLTDLLKTRITT